MTSSPLSPHPDQPANASHQPRTADGSHRTPPVDASNPAHPARPTRLVHTAAALHELPRGTGVRAVVMTMGALHEGHATLIRAARRRVGPEGQVVVTVFVNPLQFGAGEDLDRYPRTLDADVELAAAAGADVVFAPSADEVYPGGQPQIRIAAGPMGTLLEGASRPGHFDGVLTVVAKLLHLTAPDLALYGQKDAQQLAVITRMAADLNFPVEIVGVPTVREDDGLALSSRNRYLSGPERCTALALSAALFAARDRLAAEEALRVRAASVGHHPAPDRAAALAALGEDRAAADAHAVAYAAAGALHGPAVARAAARAVLDDAARLDPPLTLDYLALVDPSDFTEVPDAYEGEAILAVAAKVGSTRLIDNIRLVFGAGRPEATAAHQDGATTDAADAANAANAGDTGDAADTATSAAAAPSPSAPSITSTPPATPPTTPQGPLGATR
ncbi:pantoate--beta-alanine ligase [Streptomyces decoyicus]